MSKFGNKNKKTFSLRTSWITRLSFETLVITSAVLLTCKSKYPTSCLKTAFRYLALILVACLSPVLDQQNPSGNTKINENESYLPFIIPWEKQTLKKKTYLENKQTMTHKPNTKESPSSATHKIKPVSFLLELTCPVRRVCMRVLKEKKE